MQKHAELSDVRSCLNRSDPNEPLFVLCARDDKAPGAVRQWAANYRRKHIAAGTFNELRREKYNDALRCAAHMERWRADRVAAGVVD